jgi:hypothetical protein
VLKKTVVAATAFLVVVLMSAALEPAWGGATAYDQKGGPVDTWNRPMEQAFKVGDVINPCTS